MSEKKSTRIAYGEALAEFAGENEDIYVLDADLKSCTMTAQFAEKYPQRFINAGIAEANMADIAAGMATCGAIPIINSFSLFVTGRIYDQVRNGIAYTEQNVKIVGSHAGLTVGEDGATHQCIEDLSLMRTIPGMTVIAPCDAHETREATKAIVSHKGACYMRTGRCAVENITDNAAGYHFEIGKGIIMKEGSDVTIIACGLMVQTAMKTAEILGESGISARIIDMHTIKPIDSELVIRAAEETGAIVTAEEHNIYGGLGSAVAEVIVQNAPVPMRIVGVNDRFGHSGHPDELLEAYGLTPGDLADAARDVITKKQNSLLD